MATETTLIGTPLHHTGRGQPQVIRSASSGLAEPVDAAGAPDPFLPAASTLRMKLAALWHGVGRASEALHEDLGEYFRLLGAGHEPAERAAGTVSGIVSAVTDLEVFKRNVLLTGADRSVSVIGGSFHLEASLVVERAVVSWNSQTGDFSASVERVSLSVEVGASALTIGRGPAFGVNPGGPPLPLDVLDRGIAVEPGPEPDADGAEPPDLAQLLERRFGGWLHAGMAQTGDDDAEAMARIGNRNWGSLILMHPGSGLAATGDAHVAVEFSTVTRLHSRFEAAAVVSSGANLRADALLQSLRDPLVNTTI